jgi:hypothetical protein
MHPRRFLLGLFDCCSVAGHLVFMLAWLGLVRSGEASAQRHCITDVRLHIEALNGFSYQYFRSESTHDTSFHEPDAAAVHMSRVPSRQPLSACCC